MLTLQHILIAWCICSLPVSALLLSLASASEDELESHAEAEAHIYEARERK